MPSNYLKAGLKTAVMAVTLLLGVGLSWGQQQVNLTAAATTVTLPDGSTVPMWGYSCGAAVSGSTATCASLNPSAATGSWSPVVITVPSNTQGGLAIQLTNSLPAPVPTSLMIVGQLGGGLGDVKQRTTNPSPSHDNQPATWPIANTGPVFTPPAQAPRVQSFGTEVANGQSVLLPAWGNLRPGTYLLE